MPPAAAAAAGRAPPPARIAAAVVAIAGLASGTGCGPLSPADPQHRPPATAGLGDPYFPHYGNAGYQVEHYDLEIRYDPGSQRLDGVATLEAAATDDLTTFGLDLTGLVVETVTVDGQPAGAQRAAEKLLVDPPTDLAAGETFEVEVGYGGVPEPVQSPLLGSNGFQHTEDGAYVAGQPRSASTWYPVNDHPADKATYTIALTVPDGLAAVSNGVPVGRSTEAGWTTWEWAERAPMASYLTTLAIGDYRVHRDEHDGAPLVTAVHSSLPATVDAQLRRSGEIADQLAEWFGPYPFESYGGIALADRRLGFALETQSRPVYGPGFFAGGADATWVIVHELAHQWFGNSVSVRTWDEIWLNEGFATYAEWLWEEQDGGDTAQETFDVYWEGPGTEDGFWRPPPGDPGPAELLTAPVYERGAMALHALRRTVGDEAFFQILRLWPAEQRNGNATTAELVRLAERVSGRALGALFDDWVYGTARPAYPG